MELVQVCEATEEKVKDFLKEHAQIGHKNLKTSGYFVKTNEQITGCFTLEPVENGIFWLKQLYIARSEAMRLPDLFRLILSLAEEKNAEKIVVRSHKLMLDLILESLHFELEEESPFPVEGDLPYNKWWSYRLTKVKSVHTG